MKHWLRLEVIVERLHSPRPLWFTGQRKGSSLFVTGGVRDIGQLIDQAQGFLDVKVFSGAESKLIDAEREQSRPGEQAGLLVARIFQPFIPRQYLPISAARIAQALLTGVAAGRLGAQIIESRELHGET